MDKFKSYSDRISLSSKGTPGLLAEKKEKVYPGPVGISGLMITENGNYSLNRK